MNRTVKIWMATCFHSTSVCSPSLTMWRLCGFSRWYSWPVLVLGCLRTVQLIFWMERARSARLRQRSICTAVTRILLACINMPCETTFVSAGSVTPSVCKGTNECFSSVYSATHGNSKDGVLDLEQIIFEEIAPFTCAAQAPTGRR